MPQPTGSEIHYDRPLSNLSVKFMQDQTNFVTGNVFPIVRVNKKSDKYYKYPRSYWFRDSMQRRPPATESAGGGYKVETDNYNCDDWALHHDIPDHDRANADEPINLDRNATQWLTQQGLIRQDVQWAGDFFTTGVWTTDMTGVTTAPGSATEFRHWNDDLSTPVRDIKTGKKTILKNTGYEPNRLVLGYEVWDYLSEHPEITDKMKITDDKIVTTQLLARIFDVERVVVAKSIKTTSAEGAASDTYGFIHGKHALLCYASPQASVDVPSAGYVFMWNQPEVGTISQIGRIPVPLLKAERMEIEEAWDNKVVATDMGYFFNGAVA